MVNLGLVLFGQCLGRREEASYLEIVPEHAVRGAYIVLAFVLRGLRGQPMDDDAEGFVMSIADYLTLAPTVTAYDERRDQSHIRSASLFLHRKWKRGSISGVYPLCTVQHHRRSGGHGFSLLDPFMLFTWADGTHAANIWPFFSCSAGGRAESSWALFPFYSSVDSPKRTAFLFWRPPCLVQKEKAKLGQRSRWRVLWFFRSGSADGGR